MKITDNDLTREERDLLYKICLSIAKRLPEFSLAVNVTFETVNVEDLMDDAIKAALHFGKDINYGNHHSLEQDRARARDKLKIEVERRKKELKRAKLIRDFNNGK